MTRYRSGEALVFGVATLLVLLHALEDAFLHRGPGCAPESRSRSAASPSSTVRCTSGTWRNTAWWPAT